ncbi:MFS transporter CDS [Bradyrhizobium sp.]|nr:MFS transporter CDS [Bradyrhizobium sp.]
MADMQSGIGPFVGVFLQERGWATGLIGTALTIGNVAGMLVTTPIGGFIDSSRNKRLWVVIPGICVVLASAIILISQHFWAVTLSQVAQSLASAAIVPAVTGITLGIARQKGFNALNGRNQAFNHAGNMVGAALSGYLGYKFGYVAVFVLAAVFGAIAIACVLMIPDNSIDDRQARGSKEDESKNPPVWPMLSSGPPPRQLAGHVIAACQPCVYGTTFCRKSFSVSMASRSPPRLWPLYAVNFFMADMQSGIGPFVGVFLQWWRARLTAPAASISARAPSSPCRASAQA